jgi:N-acyl-D-aspartate/D-glutamate deacylase
LLQKQLEAGCFGMTTGLEYIPGMYAPAYELEYLAKIVGENHKLITSHVRNEDDDALEASLRELLAQGKYCQVHVSHMKSVFGKGAERAQEILNIIEEARQDSIAVTADVYPYTASFTGIGIVFPDWAKAPNNYKQVVRTRRKELATFLRDKITQRNGPEATLLGTPPYAGKTLAQIANEKNKPFEDVLIEDIGPTGASGAYFVMDDTLQETFLKSPFVMVCSDGSPTMRHPRGYGSFAKIIETYVQEKQLFPLEEAIRKMTYLSAQTMHLPDRGQVAAGKKADILVFDPRKVKAKATFEAPHQLAEGFSYVIVNGEIARTNQGMGTHRYGKILKAK